MIELVIKGRKIIDVGYRQFLLLNAMQRSIQKFYAFNVKADSQEMLLVRIQGEDEQIAQYIDFVRSNFPEHAEVGEIVERSFEGQVMNAFRSMQILQFEQMNKAIPAILSIDKKQSMMLEKQDAMLEKQDTTISILKEVKEDTSETVSVLKEVKKDTGATVSILKEVKEDTGTTVSVLKEVKEDTSAVKADISGLRRDASESLYEKYEQLCLEIAEIKATLSDIKAKVA